MARIFFSQVGSLWQSISQADPVSIARVDAAAAGSFTDTKVSLSCNGISPALVG